MNRKESNENLSTVARDSYKRKKIRVVVTGL